MNNRLLFAVGLIAVGIFCICFLGAFFLTSRLARTEVTTNTPTQSGAPISDNQETYEVAMTDSDGKLVLGDIETGTTLELAIQPLMYEWSPNSKWLYATDYQKLWLISAEGKSTQEIVPNLTGAWISWSPGSNLLALWLTEGLTIYNLDTETFFTLPGTDVYNCNYQPFAWSFDQLWVIFDAAKCNNNNIEREIVTTRVDGTEIRILDINFQGITPYPSPSDYTIAFAALEPEDGWQLYLSDFRSIDSSFHKFNDPEGRQQYWIKWLSDGSGFYSIPFNWWYPEVDFVTPETNKITVVWKDEQAKQYPGTEWSPGGTKIVDRHDRLMIFDVASGTFSEWKESLTNVCGIQWNRDDKIVAVVVCEASGDLPVSEMSIILIDGTKIRLGENLYGGTVQISSAQP